MFKRGDKKPKALHILKFIVMGAVFVTALGFGIRELWNCLIPELFHGPVITFWQGLGLCLLGKMLFGWHGGGPGGFRRNRRAWDEKLKERYANMTPEDRERMKEGLKNWCRPNNRFSRWYDDIDANADQPKHDAKQEESKPDIGTNI
ncbi:MULTISPECIES: hypothetical protein [unclassified Chitinophaga]|uniref:hypothetical protein n=1 Tax=unclassified Chitinophaga TaxID=2619133 RepID=UPI0015C40C86|nr:MULTISPECIES: hypothetical protein [unclassified Chitinophaga]WPV67337.1 hypothetical protein QQL36_01185 [Chitinophaga sp. LS1]